MNLRDAASNRPLSQEQHHEADTRLHGRKLPLGRIVWFALVVLTLSVCMASLPDYFTELQTVCRLAVCSYGQLSPDTVVALQHFGLSVGSYATFMFALATIVALVVFGTGGLIFWRKSDDWMALLFALISVMGGTFPVLFTVGTSHSAWRLPILFVSELLFLSFYIGFTLFPDGRFVPRWTRWLLVVFSIESVVITFFTNILTAFFTIPLWLGVPLVLLFFSLYAGLVIAQMYRYRYVSTLVQRQQTKWVVYGFTANMVVVVGAFLPALIFPRSLYPLVFLLVFNCTMLLYPFTMGIAILRYRLWDIDVLINRTLVYGSLTVILTGVYVGLVIGLQALLRGIISQDSGVAIVLSTLAIYFLFQPLRHRLQQLIDRRFYRRKYDAAKVVAAFSDTLRHEVDLDTLREHLLAVVRETMQPAHVSLWLRPPAPVSKRQGIWNRTSADRLPPSE
jgi:MFS family permease